MKTIRHKWQLIGFLRWRCEKCGVVKLREDGITRFQVGDKITVGDPGCIFMNESCRVKGYEIPELATDCLGNCFTDADMGL